LVGKRAISEYGGEKKRVGELNNTKNEGGRKRSSIREAVQKSEQLQQIC